MAGSVQNNTASTLFNSTFAKGPAANGKGLDPADFHKIPGATQDIYNKIAQIIGLPHVKANAKIPADPLVVRQLYRENEIFHLGNRTAAEQATMMITYSKSTGILGGTSIDAKNLASWMVSIRRDMPDKASAIENAVAKQLGNAGDQSAFWAELGKAASYPAKADAALLAMAKDVQPPSPPSRAQIIADTNALITDATSKNTFSVKGEVYAQPVTFSTERVVAQLQSLAETNPAKAQMLRAELTTRLNMYEAADINRMLAGDAGPIENITIGLNDPGDAAIGAVKGVANDGIGLVNLLARGEAMKQAGDAQQSADILRIFGKENAAAQMDQSAATLRQASQQDAIPSIPYSNAAQQGGANMVTAVELAGGIGGLAKGGYVSGKWVVKNADELLNTAKGKIDDVIGKGAKQAEDVLNTARKALGDLPLNSKSLDDLYQTGRLTMDEARSLAKSVEWKSSDGRWIYPPNNGFEGAVTKAVLNPPSKVDRYGGFIDDRGKFSDTGNFFSPLESSYGSRALPTGSDLKKLSNGEFAFSRYEIVKSFDVSSGKSTPWFGEVGNGTQHMSNLSVNKLLELGFIRKIK